MWHLIQISLYQIFILDTRVDSSLPSASTLSFIASFSSAITSFLSSTIVSPTPIVTHGKWEYNNNDIVHG